MRITGTIASDLWLEHAKRQDQYEVIDASMAASRAEIDRDIAELLVNGFADFDPYDGTVRMTEIGKQHWKDSGVVSWEENNSSTLVEWDAPQTLN